MPSCAWPAGKTAMHSQAEEKFPARSLLRQFGMTRQFCAFSSVLPKLPLLFASFLRRPIRRISAYISFKKPSLEVWYRTYVKSSAAIIVVVSDKIPIYCVHLYKVYIYTVHLYTTLNLPCLDVNSVSTRFFWFCYSHAGSPSLDVGTMQSSCIWARARHQQLSNANAA